jgi:hypothetical protein
MGFAQVRRAADLYRCENLHASICAAARMTVVQAMAECAMV